MSDFISKFSASGTRVEIKKLVKNVGTKMSVVIWKSPRMQYRCDKVAVGTTCIVKVKFKIYHNNGRLSVYRLLILQ